MSYNSGPEFSLGFSKQESQGHFLRKVGVPLCNLVKFPQKVGVPTQIQELGTADLESNENPEDEKEELHAHILIRPSLKNCMFAVLLPIILEVGR